MFDKMKQLMEMKKQADKIKKELDSMTVEVTEFDGIRLVMTCSQDFRSIDINEDLLKAENKALLEGRLLKSMNAAIKKSQQAAARSMSSMVPGF